MTEFAAPANRRCMHGMRQIVEFNWPRFVGAALAAVACLVVLSACQLGPFRPFVVVGLTLAVWWTLASLAVSWWVYDATSLTNWHWLAEFVPSPARWANVHAGFDETTEPLRRVLEGATGTTIDIYDETTMPEASIARARRRYPSDESQSGSYRRLPLSSASQDALFLLFAAHELRLHAQRVRLLQEASRVLGPGGRIVIVEHLRDIPNFIAFGPGALHFHSRRAWARAFRDASLSVQHEHAVNPFVHFFVLEHSP